MDEQTDQNPDTNKQITDRRQDVSFLKELWQQARLVWNLMFDPEVPAWLKVLPGLAIGAYVLMPVDLIPDFIPVFGILDDVTLMLAGAKVFIEMAPPDVVKRHRVALAEGISAAPDIKSIIDKARQPVIIEAEDLEE